MQTITADSEIQDVLKYIGVGEGQELRESEKRRRMLEKFAKFRSREPQTSLSIRNVNTAFVEAETDDKGNITSDFLDITIPSKRFEKEIDLPDDYHDYLMQRAFTVHEVGHILYSDAPTFKDVCDKIEGEEKHDAKGYVALFQNLFNALEDGAIEKFLGEDYRVSEELTALRASLHENTYIGKRFTVEDDYEYQYPFFFAIMAAVINFGIYDNGETEKLVDPNNDKHTFAEMGGEVDRSMFIDSCLPLIKEYIEKIQSEYDGSKRVELSYELWRELLPYIKRSDTPGVKENQARQDDQEDGESYLVGVPVNISDAHGEERNQPSSGGGEEDDEGERGDDDGKMFGQSRKEDVENNNIGDDIEEKAEEGIREETKQHGGKDWTDEIEKALEILSAGDGIDEIGIPDDGEIDVGRKREAEMYGRRAERIFNRRLKQVRKDKILRNKRRGDFDTRRLIPAERGDTRIFKQIKRGDEKDYSCVIIVDRSGSMGMKIKDVELAAGAVAYGLEENGVDTCILDTSQNMTTLTKPFGTEVGSFEKKLFAGRCGGGTPLRYTMRYCRERIKVGSGKVPFAIVITDGRPAKKRLFKEEVKKASFPVLGLYLNNNRDSVEDQLKLYDKGIVVASDDDVMASLMNLINRIVF